MYVEFSGFKFESSTSITPEGTTIKLPSGLKTSLLKNVCNVSSWKSRTCLSCNEWSLGTGSVVLLHLFTIFFVFTSNILKMRSVLMVAKKALSGSQLTPCTNPLWSCKIVRFFPFWTSQTIAVLSTDPLKRKFEFGLHDKSYTSSMWPRRIFMVSQISLSWSLVLSLSRMFKVSDSGFCRHTNITLSSSDEAKYSPLGDHLTQLTARWCLIKSAAKSRETTPSSWVRYQILNWKWSKMVLIAVLTKITYNLYQNMRISATTSQSDLSINFGLDIHRKYWISIMPGNFWYLTLHFNLLLEYLNK